MSNHQLYITEQHDTSLNMGSSEGQQTAALENVESLVVKLEPIAGPSDKQQTKRDDNKNYLSDASDEEVHFITSLNNKLPYTLEEDELILKFMLKGNNIFKASSLSLWKYLETKKENPKRTYQSLKNRFLRNIKPNIFTTYKYLITNDEMVDKILKKYPELKIKLELNVFENSQRTTTNGRVLINNEVPNTNFTIKRNPVTQSIQKKYEKQIIIPASISKPNGNLTEKTVEFKNGIIFITIQCNNTEEDCTMPKFIGIYDKYLNLKKNNVVTPCTHCGRGDPISDSQNEKSGSSMSESFINCSVDLSEQKDLEPEVLIIDENLMDLDIQKRKSPKNTRSRSPSLLENVTNAEEYKPPNKIYITRNKSRHLRTITSATISSACKDLSQTSDSSEILKDREINSLFERTVADWKKFMDSDEEEHLVNEFFKKNQNQVDVFFTDKYPSSSDSMQSSTNEFEVQNKKSSNKNIMTMVCNMAPLAKNMVNMLSEEVEEKKKLESFSSSLLSKKQNKNHNQKINDINH